METLEVVSFAIFVVIELVREGSVLLQVWSTSEIESAITGECCARLTVQKLQSILRDVKRIYSVSTDLQKNDDTLQLLVRLGQLTIANPSGMCGVWVAGGSIICGNDECCNVTGSGYSIAQAVVELITEIAVIDAVTSVERLVTPCSNVTVSYPCLLKYSDLLTAQLGANLSSCEVNQNLTLSHLGNRATVPFPEELCRRAVPTMRDLLVLTHQVAAHCRQLHAIELALLRAFAKHCAEIWRFKQRPPREIMPASLQLFKHCTNLCQPIEYRRLQVLLDISDDWGPQVFVALSYEADGFKVATGTGCGKGSYAAISSAVLELRKSELLLDAALRKQHGDLHLSKLEQETLTHADVFNIFEHEMLTSAGRCARREQFYPELTFVRAVAREAEANGVDIFYTDITSHSNNLSVVKVVSPQLLVGTDRVHACA